MNLGIRVRLFLCLLAFVGVTAVGTSVFVQNSPGAIGTFSALCAAAVLSWFAARWLSRPIRTLGSDLADTAASLRGERDLLQRVLNDMREGVLLVAADGTIKVANRALRDMLLIPAAAEGRRFSDVVGDGGLVSLIANTGGRGAGGPVEFDLGGMKPRNLLVNAAPLASAEGGVLVVFVDVTEAKRLETMRRDFVANVSHELRNPIASIRSAAETLEMAGGGDKAQVKEFAEIVGRNAARMARIVDDLLDISRLESSQYRLNPIALDVGQVVVAVLEHSGGAATKKRITLSSEAAPGTPPALADPKALEQVLSNLVDNAVKYCPEGVSIAVRVFFDGGVVHVSVQDTGPGIEARHIPRLFERFYRVDAGRSRELGGTGLGLSIVKHLVSAMGGEVSVESVPGRGSSFSFTLPKA